MWKTREGLPMSVHRVACTTRLWVAWALLTEKIVLTPFGSSRATSKYGRSKVAAGTLSMVPISARAGGPEAARASRSSPVRTCLMDSPPSWFQQAGDGVHPAGRGQKQQVGG